MSMSVIVEKKASENSQFQKSLLIQSEDRKPIIAAEFIQALRQQAAWVSSKLSLPSKKDEDWRFTDLSELYKIDFQNASEVQLTSEVVNPFILEEASHSRLTFVNGVYSTTLSETSALPDSVYVGNLANLSDVQQAQIAQYLGRHEGATEPFTVLNTAGLTDVAVVWAKPNTVVEIPIHLLFLTAAKTPSFIQPRILVVTERGAILNLVEDYGFITQNCPYLTNTVTEIWLQENAQVNHTRVQRESEDGFHIAKSAIAQARHSRYTINEVSLGAKLYRHTLHIDQTGEQTETTLNGLTAIAGVQVSDTHSAVHLNHPHGTTNQLHKCIVDGSAHAVFNGKIFVPKAAQLTNAAQLNRNLLLSPKARVNTKPELQITADNVKCSHGATVSQLEADELFYLRSRGLTEDDARHLLLDAFAAEILDKLPLASLCQQLTQYLFQ